MKIGVIAEDDSDVVVVKELTRSLMKPRKVGFKRFVGNGCGKLRRKCHAWAEILVRRGCPWIVLVHDLDEYDETALRTELSNAIVNSGAKATVVLIPRREIEAWLLYDSEAIAKAFNERKKPHLPHDPELLSDHNELIAKYVDVSLLQRSRSFARHPPFVSNIF